TRWPRDWSSDVCSSDLGGQQDFLDVLAGILVFLCLQRVRRADPLHRDAPEISAGARSSANSGGMGMPSRPWPREAPPKQYRADLAPADGTAHQPPRDGRARRLYPPEPGSGEELSRD